MEPLSNKPRSRPKAKPRSRPKIQPNPRLKPSPNCLLVPPAQSAVPAQQASNATQACFVSLSAHKAIFASKIVQTIAIFVRQMPTDVQLALILSPMPKARSLRSALENPSATALAISHADTSAREIKIRPFTVARHSPPISAARLSFKRLSEPLVTASTMPPSRSASVTPINKAMEPFWFAATARV